MLRVSNSVPLVDGLLNTEQAASLSFQTTCIVCFFLLFFIKNQSLAWISPRAVLSIDEPCKNVCPYYIEPRLD